MSNPPATAPATRPPELILASGSRYRAALLARLRLPFRIQAAQADETPQPGETAPALALRLSAAKAGALRAQYPNAWILGSDQVAVVDGIFLGKPGSRERALAQLRQCSGRTVEFMTGVVLLTPQGAHQGLDITTVRFRTLTEPEIVRYVDTEPALDCAGSFKCEGYGITLFESIDSRDPTGLIGLPLITVCRLLREAGYSLP
ncbi:septum formation protein [Fontimonas thermophila]|uniref:7-methyl-GTP pyrophosphatase n=1 Tax=Fontimonas thermophila TaxID=1076937 RepID=A0A1I2IEU5_9GAMM|nr:nucleoside triphosphate pyrophosphatase [Fontimonas thermophila]SFF40168.1 septum formation protein [Fontimonas thermophila]